MNKIKIKVDVVSDVVCPWCYIGKKRLETAIDSLSDQYEVDIHFQPFELNPDMPQEGRDQKEYLANKFGSAERYEELTQHVTTVASKEGLNFNFADQQVSPNTFDAHRLIWLAEKEGVQPPVKEALMSAYFEKGIDLSKKANLIDVVASAGLDREKATQLLSSEEGIAEVKLLEQTNYQRRISGVPFYIINNKYGISGAQPAEVFVQALTQVGKELQLEGEACDVESRKC
jgi:predicted DsbA family dithiol-disulfide isomerase